MPRVSDQLLQATVYLYATKEAAEDARAAGGSGVLVGRSWGGDSGNVDLFFVTCDHVATFGAPVVRVLTRIGEVEIVKPKAWVPHFGTGPDVAVARFKTVHESGGNCPYSFVPLDRFVTLDDFKRPLGPPEDQPYYLGELVGAGDSTLVVGRFLAEDGVLSQTPTVRFGNLASAGTVVIKFPQPRPSEQECLLVESHSLPGYSGSAVYHFHPANTWNGLDVHIGLEEHPLWKFLGVDCGHMNTKVDAAGRPTPGWAPAMAIPGVPRATTANAGMMTVVPAWKVKEALEDEMRHYEPPEPYAELDSPIP